MAQNQVLILGVGNEILTDDSIGPRIANDLEKMFPDSGADFMISSLGGLEVLELICNYKEVIIIDAIRTRDGEPGTVYLMKPDDFKETLHLSSFHDVNFLTALKLGEELDFKVPEEISIIAIEIIEDLVFSNDLTPPLRARYPDILKEISQFLEKEHSLLITD